MNKIDQILTNFMAWEDSNNRLGVVDVETPNFEALTETIKGAGIGGEYSSPVIGHFGSQKLKLNWRSLTKEAAMLAKQKVHNLEFHGNQQIFDPATGYSQQAIVVKTLCVPVNFNPVKFAVASSTDTANEFEVHYIKIVIGGRTYIEYDRFNLVFIVDGVDQLEEVRQNIGLT